MRKTSLLSLIISLTACFKMFGAFNQSWGDSTATKRIGIGGIPILAYDPDLGLRFGAVINLFDFGNREIYPEYYQSLNIKAFRGTKGSSHISAIFESDKLIPSFRVISEATWIDDSQLDFFGFNGKKAYFNKDFIDPGDTDFVNKLYYAHQRKLIRLRANFNKNIFSSHWKLQFGLIYEGFKISESSNKELSAANSSAENSSLYKQYIDWKIIEQSESAGGDVLTYMAGISLDTRNHRINCNQGLWFETYFLASDLLRSRLGYIRHTLSFRQYFNFNNAKTVFSYRLSSQQNIYGKAPFYTLPFFNDTRQTQDGLGGAFTLRGVYRNRISADGYIMGNFELRTRLAELKAFRLNWQIVVSAFGDAVYITREYGANSENVPQALVKNHFTDKKQVPHVTFGKGLYLIYNQNNIISLNLGISPDKQLGNIGFYVGSSFLF
jgi:hypothetical protein